MERNTLYYGDNLTVLREFPAACVDLIYLDPPFNSNRSYNVLFKDESGQEADAQLTAFEDTWHWNHKAEETYHALVTQGDEAVSRMIEDSRIQIVTIQELLDGASVQMPPTAVTFKQAAKAEGGDDSQLGLFK